MKLPRFSLTEWAILLCIVIAIAFLLSGCTSKRDQAIADSQATIWEAAEAIRLGAPIDGPTHAIQANASATAAAVGATYPPKAKP